MTRRLLRTERVQSLINTIKDALICALQLHTVDNIDETDVELHRRLINQASKSNISLNINETIMFPERSFALVKVSFYFFSF